MAKDARALAGRGRSTPINEGMIARIARGAQEEIQGVDWASAWMPPGQPFRPVAPNVPPRRTDFPVGYNLSYIPRSYSRIGFPELRALADSWDLLRLVIETRKDQMVRLPFEWRLEPLDGEAPSKTEARAKKDDRIKMLNDFFASPDGEHSFQDWERMILEDMFVIDAPTVLPRWRIDGGMYGFDVLAGDFIHICIDSEGRSPKPPNPAYQQILKGMPTRDLLGKAPDMPFTDQILYFPRNLRSNEFYGYSPVEQIVVTINTAIRRQLWQLEFYTEGTIPDGWVEMPKEMTPAQVKQFEVDWNSKFATTAERRKVAFMPEGSKYQPLKTEDLHDTMDEWLARVVCFNFNIPATPFVRMMNRATASQMSEDAKAEGLEPCMAWWQEFMNSLVHDYIGWKDISHTWGDITRVDPLKTAQVDAIYLQQDPPVKFANEVREQLGLDPYEGGSAEDFAKQQQIKQTQQAESHAMQMESGSFQATGEPKIPKPGSKAAVMVERELNPRLWGHCEQHDLFQRFCPDCAQKELALQEACYPVAQKKSPYDTGRTRSTLMRRSSTSERRY